MEFTESYAFCTSCHDVMSPEAMTFKTSPHAGLACGDCHVGPGTWLKIRAHLVSVRYVWEYPLGGYLKPIPIPIHSLPATEKICISCHLVSAFPPARLRLIDEYASDEANTLRRIQLTMRTGTQLASPGFGRGSHWHVANRVHYIAGDESRQTIPWVQVVLGDSTVEYLAADSALTPEQIQQSQKRRMDCVDCHNRAQHGQVPPDKAMNRAMSAGLISADLPQIKRLGVEILSKRYATDAEAAADIRAIADFYANQYADLFAQLRPEVEAAVTAIQVLYQQSRFSFMNVYWDT